MSLYNISIHHPSANTLIALIVSIQDISILGKRLPQSGAVMMTSVKAICFDPWQKEYSNLTHWPLGGVELTF